MATQGGDMLSSFNPAFPRRQSSLRPFAHKSKTTPVNKIKATVQQLKPTLFEISQTKGGVLWCKLPVVKNSDEFSAMSSHEKKLQEAKFEIAYTESTFLREVTTYERSSQSTLFTPEVLQIALSERDRKTLCAHVTSVRQTSEDFLSELEVCWQEDIQMPGMFRVIYSHAAQKFQAYVKFCINEAYARQVLNNIRSMSKSPITINIAKTFSSYLVLPMQRITRLPLLLENVLKLMRPDDQDYTSCKMALEAVRKITNECNENVRNEERMREIITISEQIYFPADMTPLALTSESRWLVRSSDVTLRWHEVWDQDDDEPHAGETKQSRHLFLFNDLFIVTRKKSDDSWTVISYCQRRDLQVNEVRRDKRIPHKLLTLDQSNNFTLLITILKNQENKIEQMVVSVESSKVRRGWIEDMNPPSAEGTGVTTYALWAQPLVQALFEFIPRQPDELRLCQNDKLRVIRAFDDGWFEGEQVTGGERGLFPQQYVFEVENAKVRLFAGLVEDTEDIGEGHHGIEGMHL